MLVKVSAHSSLPQLRAYNPLRVSERFYDGERSTKSLAFRWLLHHPFALDLLLLLVVPFSRRFPSFYGHVPPE